MAHEYTRGKRVRALATCFDAPGTENAWSREQFGENYNTSEIFGIVVRVLANNKVRVRWDIDGENSIMPIELINPANDVSDFEDSVQLQPENEDTERDDSSSSSSIESESEDETVAGIPNSEQSPDMSTTEKIVTVTSGGFVHSTTVILAMKVNVTIDNFKDIMYKPRLQMDLSNVAIREMDIWLLFFPMDKINDILRYTNAKVERNMVSPQELLKFFGILYAMCINVLPERRDYWSTNETGVFPPPAFGTRFGMSKHRFEEILMNLSFTSEQAHTDRWFQVRPLIDMVNERWLCSMTPSYKLTVEESMFAWYGRGNYSEDGMPAVIKIKRKPKGIGCEVKTLADSCTRIMLRLEINEGKNSMTEKKWQRQLGAGTATTLRLTEPWHGTGRIIIGDSWFASVKTAIELRKKGLFFIGIVKTAHAKFPLKQLQENCSREKGATITAKTDLEGFEVLATAWRDRKIHNFVSTCGTTLPGTPARKMRYNHSGGTTCKEIPRNQIVEQYFDGAPAIDINNHIRQGGLALEEVWRTQNWVHRIYASIFGIIETNAFLAFNYFLKSKHERVTHVEFTNNLSLQLINNNNYRANPLETKENRPSNHDAILGGDHTLQALSKDDSRQRVQRKCIICSRVHKRQQKASFYCMACGKRCVLCSPQTGRNCFAYHIQHGIPA